MPRVDPLGPLRGPHGGNKDKKDVKTGSASERRNNLVSERGHIKHSKRSQVPWGHGRFEERDQEVERLRRLVRDFKLEARNRRQ